MSSSLPSDVELPRISCQSNRSLLTRYMRTIIAALLLIVVPVGIAVPPASLETQWAEKERALEQLYGQYWRTEYQIARGDSKLSSLEIQKQIREAEIEPDFLTRLKAAKFRDPVLRRRQRLFLEEAAVTEISSDAALAKLIEEI